MTVVERTMVEKNLQLTFEFQKYVLDHPKVAERIPQDALVAFQVKKGEAFNRWSRRLARKHAKNEKTPVVFVTIKKIRPVRSRIAALKIERAA